MKFTPSPVSLEQLTQLPSADTLVVTVNNRLARRILAMLSLHLSDARQVIALPAIVPLTAWLQQIGDGISFVDGAEQAAHTVDAFGARSLWRQVIARQESDQGLLDLNQAARLAHDADRLMSEWMIDVPPELATDDYRRFEAWRQAYRQTLAQLDAEDGVLGFERVHDAVVQGLLPVDFTKLVLSGFNEFSPRLASLLDSLSARGVDVFVLQSDEPMTGDVSRVLAADPDSEWRLAAQWARDRLRADPKGRYAIVAAGLEQNVPLAHRVLSDALAVNAGEPALPYNMAAARPLSDWPAVRAALAWLRLAQLFAQGRRCEPSLAGAALLAGGCVADLAESGGRARVDALWREKGTLELRPEDFLSAVEPWAPRLAQAWRDCMVLGTALDDARTDVWAQRFRGFLQCLGFPGDAALNSHAFQVVEAFDRLLDRYARQAPILGRLGFAQAVSSLAQLARETPFQPQRDPDARLEVQGFLEAEGGRWDGVWLLGLTDEALPAAARPNPLIPLSVLRRVNAPRATPERELQWAQTLFQALLRSAPRVWASSARQEGERELRPSPFLDGLPLVEIEQEKRESRPCRLERLVDDQGPPLRAGGQTRGGIGVLDTQARNPLWAFVKYRLGARELPDYAVLADQNARGLFLHGALENVFRTIDGHESLCGLIESGGLDALVEEALRSAANEHLQAYGPVLRELEIERAAAVVTSWLELEQARSDYSIHGLERVYHWSHGALELTLRLDRIDRLADGRLAVIDYKTGGGNLDPRRNWFRERPIELQLPFYAAVLAAEQAPVAALALARLHARKVEFVGLADGECGMSTLADVSEIEGAGSWSELMRRWRAAIETMAQEYVDGVAVNDNLRDDDLKYCDVRPFLRLEEENGAYGDDE